MNRFEDNDFDDHDEEEFEYNDYSGEYDDDMDEPQSIPPSLLNQWKRSEMEVETERINLQVLERAVAVLQKSFFWRFRSLNAKLYMISDTYYAMLTLIRNDE